MNNNTIRLKVQQRINKLASADFDNIHAWQIVEAFNKAVVNWCRRNLHGLNVKQTGDEQSKARIDDLQIILTQTPVIPFIKKDGYYESANPLPADYFEWKRLSAKATSPCCEDPRQMVITLAEEANVDELNRDFNKKPSFEWGETYCTMKDNRIRIHTNNEFDVPNAILFYYRQPRRIQMAGVQDPYSGITPILDVECEFKDDLVELFVDETVKILTGDIESFNPQQNASQQVEGNN